MSTPDVVPPAGFLGRRGAVLCEASDDEHHVRIVEYRFDDGSTLPYVELHETHDGSRPGRVVSLSAIVHLAQNVSDAELWQIGNRETRPADATGCGCLYAEGHRVAVGVDCGQAVGAALLAEEDAADAARRTRNGGKR
mgnify:CR=1 FL=1